MRMTFASSNSLWRSCAEPGAAWFLVWMPLALLLFDPTASASNAMARFLAVLLVAALLWARGLGPRGAVADRLFVAAWVGSWAAALGTLVTAGAWTASATGSVALFGTLLIGAGWLGWAFHERQELLLSHRSEASPESSSAAPTRPAAILAAWLLAFSVLAVLVRSGHAHWSDGIVLFVSLACFTAFQATPSVEAEPESAT